ncbi:DUF1996 domain-containing protein [Actinophytocola sp.]|uniref:DUF1996 domain-containing protein n=1 Tax=Actinophytocola sp. TaxID=1872138 RepID=UPI003D6C65DA
MRNAAEHTHDYVGNTATDAFSDNEVLAGADTTCVNGDLSTYYWPVIRLRENDPAQDQADPENPHNLGTILHPSSAEITFEGNAQNEVVEMPDFLQVSTGDSKGAVERKDSGNARAQWTCSGFEDQISGTQYPLCPEGSQTIRILEFPGCWDGENIDSAENTHIEFADEETGECPEGFQAVPQLNYKLSFDIPPGQLFALDAFPGELHSPITDHGDFINVMDEELMQEVVDTINSGQQGSS